MRSFLHPTGEGADRPEFTLAELRETFEATLPRLFGSTVVASEL